MGGNSGIVPRFPLPSSAPIKNAVFKPENRNPASTISACGGSWEDGISRTLEHDGTQVPESEPSVEALR